MEHCWVPECNVIKRVAAGLFIAKAFFPKMVSSNCLGTSVWCCETMNVMLNDNSWLSFIMLFPYLMKLATLNPWHLTSICYHTHYRVSKHPSKHFKLTGLIILYQQHTALLPQQVYGCLSFNRTFHRPFGKMWKLAQPSLCPRPRCWMGGQATVWHPGTNSSFNANALLKGNGRYIKWTRSDPPQQL